MTKKPDDFVSLLSAYGRNRAVTADSDYTMTMASFYHQLFAHDCKRDGAVPRHPNNMSHFSCVSCIKHFKNITQKKKISQTIRESANKIIAATIACSKQIDLTPIDNKQMRDFTRMPGKHLSETEMLLMNQVESEVCYYDSKQKLIDLKRTAEVKTDNDFVPS